jgi:hypothetical protein
MMLNYLFTSFIGENVKFIRFLTFSPINEEGVFQDFGFSREIHPLLPYNSMNFRYNFLHLYKKTSDINRSLAIPMFSYTRNNLIF